MPQQDIVYNRGLYKNVNFYEKQSSKYKRDSSPTFGSPIIGNKPYENQN